MAYLSKSDFKLACDCPTKLYYKKLGYPSVLADDAYMQFLAEGGYMIEAIAKLLYPEGHEVPFENGIEEAARETMKALKADSVTLFEPTLVSKGKMARVDILKKVGKRFQLIEVKAKSIDSSGEGDYFRGTRGGIKPDWRPYLEDVAFQAMVLKELFPGVIVEPYLCLVDKAGSTDIDTIFARFELTESVSANQKFSRPNVRFTGDVEALRRRHFLKLINVESEVGELANGVREMAERFLESLQGEVRKIPPTLSTICRGCEYRNDPQEGVFTLKSGFHECWGKLADPSPHILEYYYGGSIGGRNNPVINNLISRGRTRFTDIEEDDLVKTDGEVGMTNIRQRIQRQYTIENREYISDDLARILGAHSYPLHFVDFETSRTAVPYHAGMRPYEQVAFQWSCHTMPTPGAPLEHSEWINVQEAYPNFDFAKSLREKLGNSGTFYMWSKHERSVLKDIMEQMDVYHCPDDTLHTWLDDLINETGALKMVDLCELAKAHYFHPAMKGRLSIKYVLPAVWNNNSTLHSHPEFARYFKLAADGSVLGPYATLDSLPFGDGEDEEEVVNEGGGAMRAYQEMMYGLSKSKDDVRAKWRQLLLQYCKLDTAAMVMIWTHWIGIRK